MLIFLTCCVYFEYVSGLKSSSKSGAQGLPKLQPSDINRDGGSVLDIRGGVDMFCLRLRSECVILNRQLLDELLHAFKNTFVHFTGINFITIS